MTASFPGTCDLCGAPFEAEVPVRWRENGIEHEDCACRAEAALAALGGEKPIIFHSTTPPEVSRPLRRINGGGAVPLVVRRRHIREDALSGGPGVDWGLMYEALCRPASPEEAAMLDAREAQMRQGAPWARAHLRTWLALRMKILASSDSSETSIPRGRQWPEQHPNETDYLVIEPASVWLITHPGRPGASLPLGKDSIASKAPITAEIRALLVELRALAA